MSSNPCSPANTPRNVQNLKPANSSSAYVFCSGKTLPFVDCTNFTVLLYVFDCCRLNNPDGKEDVVTVLQNQLHEKDSVLTDIRLDALKSAHEVDELREAITKLKVPYPFCVSYNIIFIMYITDSIVMICYVSVVIQNENVHLRHHNERLRVAANQHSRASSQNSLPLFAQNDDTESISEGNVLSDMSAPACVGKAHTHSYMLI